jgi:flagella basal body P-ring formation protein FlgA
MSTRPRLDRNRQQRLASVAYWVLTLTLFLTIAGPLSPSIASASDEVLLEAVHAFLFDQFAEGDDQVDIRIQLPPAQMPPCTSPQPFLPPRSRSAQGRLSIGVRCGEQGQQVRYLQAEIDRYGEYPVLVREIDAGTEVTAALLRSEQGNLNALPRDSVLEADAIIGQIARRRLAAGVPLQLRQFQIKPLVERGQQVVVEARGSNFRVSREGKALDSGGLGEQVRVQFSNRDVINGSVVGKGRLAVDF